MAHQELKIAKSAFLRGPAKMNFAKTCQNRLKIAEQAFRHNSADENNFQPESLKNG